MAVSDGDISVQSKREAQVLLVAFGIIAIVAIAYFKGIPLTDICPYLGLMCLVIWLFRVKSWKHRILIILLIPVIWLATVVGGVYIGFSIVGQELERLVDKWEAEDLHRLGLQSVDKEALLGLYRSPDPEIRERALELLTRKEFREDKDVQEAVIEGLKDP